MGPACPQLEAPTDPRASDPPPGAVPARPAPPGWTAGGDRSLIPMALATGPASASAGVPGESLHRPWGLSDLSSGPLPLSSSVLPPSHPHGGGGLQQSPWPCPRQCAPQASPSSIPLLAFRGIHAALGNRPLSSLFPFAPPSPSPSSAPSPTLGFRLSWAIPEEARFPCSLSVCLYSSRCDFYFMSVLFNTIWSTSTFHSIWFRVCTPNTSSGLCECM